MEMVVGGLLFSVSVFLLGKYFSQDFIIPALLILAIFSYMWVYDLSEITLNTLIIRRSSSETQSKEFAQKKIAQSVGMLFGIITGGVLSFFGSTISQFFLGVVLFFAFFFFRSHFENQEEDVPLEFSSDSVNWKEVISHISNPETVKEKLKGAGELLQKKVLEVSQSVSEKLKMEVQELAQLSAHAPDQVYHVAEKTKLILNEARLILIDLLASENEIVRASVPRRNFRIREIFSEMGKGFSFLSQSFSLSARYALFLSCLMVIFFSFWDTMAITYQPLFLQRFDASLGIFSALILPLFLFPVFVFQYPFALLAEKIGAHVMMVVGLGISGVSLMILGTLDTIFDNSIWLLILAGMGNTTGYAAAFSAAQGKFVSEMRYKASLEGKTIDDGIFASALQLALNVGNIIGQLFGGMIFSLFGFYIGFLLIGVFLTGLFMISLFFVGSMKTPKKINDEGGQEVGK